MLLIYYLHKPRSVFSVALMDFVVTLKLQSTCSFSNVTAQSRSMQYLWGVNHVEEAPGKQGRFFPAASNWGLDMSLITEPPEADCHKSGARSSHYCTGKHMVSGIFSLNCGTLKNEGWGHGELTIMRNPEGVEQWRASDKHVIYCCRLSTVCFIETPETRGHVFRHMITSRHSTWLLYMVAVTTSTKFQPVLFMILGLVCLIIKEIWHESSKLHSFSS